VLAPAGAELLDLSPYGARVRLPGITGASVQLRLRLQHTGSEFTLRATVLDRQGHDARLRFETIDGALQQELFRMARAQMFCETIAQVFTCCEGGEAPPGLRLETRPAALLRIADRLALAGVRLTFDRLRDGRPLTATALACDPEAGSLEVDFGASVPAVDARLRYAAAAHHESYLLEARVLAASPNGLARLSLPHRCVLSDRRAEPRGPGGGHVHLGGHRCRAVDTSPRGLRVALGALVLRRDQRLVVRGPGVPERVAIVRHLDSAHAGLMFLEGASVEAEPLRVRTVDHVPEMSVASGALPAQRITFGPAERPLVGLWSDNGLPGPRALVVVPPAWAKTKECAGLLAQILGASFAASGRHVAVLRLDYTNALGESHKGEAWRRPGHECVGLRLSDCVCDVRAAIDYGTERLGEASCALIGMSFSGPVCLRVAATDERVGALAQLMGASDLRDLIRTATGGVDYVGRHRAGLRSQLQNVLGVLSDTDRWCADGLAAELLEIADAQADAARLRCPVQWVCGLYDAFVNEARVRAVLAAASQPRELVRVPAGHVPTRSAEARLAFAPVVEFLLERLGVEPALALPSAEACARQEAREWAAAPRTHIASPQRYWRDYMLGTTEAALGFEVLAMSREYHAFMADQIACLGVADHTVYDLGGGLGHALPELRRQGARSARLYDLVPELLERASARGTTLGLPLETRSWDANDGPPPVDEARRVLLSLFLSTLPDAGGFLRRLHAALPPGAEVVASSICPDADLSRIYAGLLTDIESGATRPPPGYDRERLRQAVRDYVSSAAWLLRLTEEGAFRLYDAETLGALLREAGFEVREVRPSFGAPPRAVILRATR